MSTTVNESTQRSGRPLPPALRDLALRLRDDVRAQTPQMSDKCGGVPVTHYFSQQRYEQEMQTLFRHYPVIVGHIDQLPGCGDLLRHDALGLPLLLSRDEHGKIHCFINACRHRSMRLQEAPQACGKRSIVCPYHGWTYQLDGQLKHVPHDYAFPDLEKQANGLVELPCEQRHGLIWVHPTPAASMDLDIYLGSINDDFSYLGLDDAVLYKRTETLRAANWKLIIDAFLEAYHLRVLHRDSIYPFFEDSFAASQAVPPHLRSAVARRTLADTEQLPKDIASLSNLVSYTHFIFPNTICVFHPDYASTLTFFPDGPERLRWVHYMQIPKDQNTTQRKPHWEKTVALIEKNVFENEDLSAAEGMQIGLRSGANQNMNLGRLEYMIGYFHDQIQQAIDVNSP